MSWEKMCHGHDLALLLNVGLVSGGGDGGSLLVNESDAAVACFSEIELFWDAMFETVSATRRPAACSYMT